MYTQKTNKQNSQVAADGMVRSQSPASQLGKYTSFSRDEYPGRYAAAGNRILRICASIFRARRLSEAFFLVFFIAPPLLLLLLLWINGVAPTPHRNAVLCSALTWLVTDSRGSLDDSEIMKQKATETSCARESAQCAGRDGQGRTHMCIPVVRTKVELCEYEYEPWTFDSVDGSKIMMRHHALINWYGRP